jgi:urease accessory protein
MLVFGRTARGERFTYGRLHDAWRVRQGGRLVWADAFHLEGDVGRELAHPAGLDQAVAYATVIYVAADAPAWLATARRLLEDAASRAAATVVNGILLARFLGRDAQALRSDVMHFYAGMRAAVAGLPRRLPRVWAT